MFAGGMAVLLLAHRLDLHQGLDFPRVARLLCRSVIDQVFIKGLPPPPKAVKAAFLGCPWQSLRHLFSQLRQSISQHECRIGLS